MNAHDKIAAALAYLERRGVTSSNAPPPHYRLLWALGIYIPPPHFQSVPGLFLLNAILFGVGFSGMALFFERHSAPIELMLDIGPPCGIIVGLHLVCIYRWAAWRLGLPPWSEFPPDRAPGTEADARW